MSDQGEPALERIREAAASGSAELDLSKLGLTELPDELWELTHLTRLVLSGNQLTGVPEAISHLTNLTMLDLSYNQLTGVPEAISRLTNLTTLVLSGNQLTEVPEAIFGLTNLTTLGLSGNQLTGVPDAISRLTNLTELYLSGNQLTGVPDAISRLTNLTELHLSGNQLRVLPDAIFELRHLTTLDLSQNHFTALTESISRLEQRITRSLGSFRDLTCLRLEGNQLKTIPKEIYYFINLVDLNLSGNQLTVVPEKISGLSHLRKLDLRGNQLDIPREILERWQEPPFLFQYLLATRVFKLSAGMQEAVGWANALAASSDPCPPSIDSTLLLQGVLLNGDAHPNEKVISADLLEALGGSALTVLEINELPAPSEGALELAPDALSVLSRASTFTKASGVDVIHVRHFLAAVLWPHRSQELSAHTYLLGRGDLLTRLQTIFRSWVAEDRFSDGVATWERLIAPPERSPFVGFSNDNARALEDRLEINQDVNALASVLAAKNVEPPLSIGLFGDWGSGKTFFMDLLERRIEELAKASTAAGKRKVPSAYCSEIIQIRFNAWHYIDANLWASLVTHIFDELNAQLTKADKVDASKLVADLQSTKDQIKDQIAGIDAAKRVITANLVSVNNELKELETKRKSAELGLHDLKEGIKKKALDSFEEVKRKGKKELLELEKKTGLDAENLSPATAASELRSTWTLGARIWSLLRYAPGRWKFLLIVGLALMAFGVPLGLVLFHKLDLARGQTIVASATAAIAGILPAWLAIRKYVDSIVTEAEKIRKEADEAEAVLRNARTAQEELGTLRQSEEKKKEEELERKKQTLEQKQVDIDCQLKVIQEGHSFKHYVLQRSADDNYRKQLGLVAMIHRDLKELSERLLDPKDEPHVERVVLYVDDLDRCPADQVVAVLQAVHLMLSFKLFVVVVGVDSRWLLHSLEEHYAAQLSTPRHGATLGSKDNTLANTPHNYLEKIFQIPFTMSPMKKTGFGSLIDSLVSAPAKTSAAPKPAPAVKAVVAPDPAPAVKAVVAPDPAPAVKAVVAPDPTPAVKAVVAPDPAPAVKAVVAPDPAPPAKDNRDVAQFAPRPASPPGKVPVTRGAAVELPSKDVLPGSGIDDDELVPANLMISAEEIAFMKDNLDSTIGSPRAAKRFLNIYRILRASPGGGHSGLKDDVSRDRYYRLLQIFLSVIIGHPICAGQLFQELLASNKRNDSTTLLAYLEERAKADRAEEDYSWDDLQNMFKKHEGELTDWQEVLSAVRSTARFSFHTGRALAAARRSDRSAPSR